ncbi:MAG: Blue-light-activated protein [Polyangiaceae bacterium]|jgi:PAS domain S-box-containing protein|nr:Blue-light-activated protein [Polyangiaceae bacterium]
MKQVLIVEDNEQNLYYLQSLLQGHGFHVVSARHGAEALIKARQNPPKLVISDLLMPIMDGYTLLRHWKADPRLRAIPFIVYTATYTEAEDERLAFSLGADAFILKPSEPDDFMKLIHEVAARQGKSPLRPEMDTHAASTAQHLYSETLIRKLEEKSLQLEEANRSLRQEQAELILRDRAIRAVSQGIVITDPHAPGNPIIYASPSFTQLTGYSTAECVGRNCRFLQGAETDKAEVARIRAAVAEGRECTTELLNYRKDGTPFWNSLAISPVLDSDGQLLHFVGIQTDVTERRELASQLRQAQKMEAIGQLAAGVAHDFNNLMSVVLSYSILIFEQLKPNDPLRADVDQIRQAGERATNLVRQLLAFSRRQMLEPRTLNLAQIVLGMEKMLKHLLGENFELALVAGDGSSNIRADPTQVEQIVMNLVVNARDAMPAGGKLSVEISSVALDAAYVATHPEVAPGRYVMLAITDKGAGMTAAVREKIFEPFFTTKATGKGTGLGLSTVFGIVKQSHGHIGVDSEPGVGSTFKVYFPQVEGAATSTSLPSLGPSTLTGDETILLVEDDDQVRAMLCMLLRRYGYEVLEAQNGGEAFLISEQHSAEIHLLLTDVVMPRMNGKQLAERLAPLRPAMKVLFMSGYTDNAVFRNGVLEADVAFLQKPLLPNALLRRTRAVLDS